METETPLDPQQHVSRTVNLDAGVHLDVDRKLLKQYANARRDEHEVISKLIETLEKVDDLPAAQMEQIRDALFHTDFPYLLVLVGPFSAGKSSIINALLGQKVLDVGAIPTTDHIHILRYGPDFQVTRVGETTTIFHPHPLLESLSFVDTPGLESVFEKHDAITRRFLHRADMVFLVMVATHVLSASNLDFLHELRDYGKRSIIIINQVDVLDEKDRETVHEFVEEQSRLHMGTDPTIWMVSAKQAMEAQAENPRDEILYDTSGFAEVEEYIQETLNDSTRIRQKLETSLQIAENVRQKADELVASNLNTLTEHQKSLANIQAQVGEAARVQQRNIEDGLTEIDTLWAEATTRGTEAIGELFQFSRAFGQTISGVTELIGVAGLIRRFGRRTRAEAAFEKHDVAKAMNKIPEATNRLNARLEGRDLQDLDDLVGYTRDQIGKLPPNLKDKVIGTVQSPLNYDRTFLRRRQNELDTIISEGSRFEIGRLDTQLRNMLIVMALWEIIVIAITLVVGATAAQSMDAGTIFAFFGATLIMGIIGLALLPLRGWFIKSAYSQRMFELKDRYHKILEEVLAEVVKYGTQLRKDTASPFTRLVESQTRLAEEMKTELDTAEQAILRIQRGLSQF